ncbi:rhodanese-like domain-containing protein [Salimicrobium sp. PL1-032A]|uniref:rhodanese-like domain-containing protein n=1 Tax=Salimicrobium sp. PL1-032A TaxID=3095364 RepID=UPI003260274F
MVYGALLAAFLIMLYAVTHTRGWNRLKTINEQELSKNDYCVIDIRDYISAHRSPYPGAENIPLSYLPRELKERFDCPKEILLVTDDERGAVKAARMLRKRNNKDVYYVKAS